MTLSPASPPQLPTPSPDAGRTTPKPTARPRRRWLRWAILAGLLIGGSSAAAVIIPRVTATARPDLLYHRVKLEALPVTVVEKGTLESADNRDVVCKVKAGAKGTFASTIKWVVDDGSIVNKGQLLIELDDSALQESYKSQSIVVEKAKAEWVKADEDFVITTKQNESDIATAVAALKVAELDLDKFLGFRSEPALNPFGAVIGMTATMTEKGEFKQRLDDVSGRLKQAESDLDAYRERSAWADRSVKLGYQTVTQAKAEQTKLSGGVDTVEKLVKEKYILETFVRERELTNLRANLEVAKIGVDKANRQAHSKEITAESERKTKLSVFQREVDRLQDIEDQIQECKLFAPQDGMVVYTKPESSRFSANAQGMIAQGEQVREGQKMMRIPDLRKMQVNTKVHEALVARIRGDDRRSTGVYESLRAGMLLNADAFSRLMSQSEHSLTVVRESVRDKEYYTASPGQRATVRVDAYPDRVFAGRVRTVAAVANSADWMASDVKTYQTLIIIEETVDGLKPDMNAEVTIHVEDAGEPVLTVPIQCVIGGAESGPKRTVYVKSATGPVERDVVLGKFNDKMIEVRSGLVDGDEIVLNPKVLLGDKAKVREDGADAPKGRGASPGGGDDKKGDKKSGGKKKGPTSQA